MMRVRLEAAMMAGVALLLPVAANADTPAQPGVPAYASTDDTIVGTIEALPTRYLMLLRDVRGFVDHVALRDGTALRPADLRIGVGLTVTILGHPDGPVFDADEIDIADTSAPYDPAAYDAGAFATGSLDAGAAPIGSVYGIPYITPTYGVAGIGTNYGGPNYYGGAIYYGNYPGIPYTVTQPAVAPAPTSTPAGGTFRHTSPIGRAPAPPSYQTGTVHALSGPQFPRSLPPLVARPLPVVRPNPVVVRPPVIVRPPAIVRPPPPPAKH